MPIPLLLLVLIIVFRISGQYVKDGGRRIDYGRCVFSYEFSHTQAYAPRPRKPNQNKR